MKTTLLIISVASLAIAADAPGPTAEQVATTYTKSLTRTADKPRLIGKEFALLCAPVSPEVKEKTYGPHLEHSVYYFRNELARGQGEKFSAGAVIVKEKLASGKAGGQPRIEAVAGMIKRPAGSLPKTGGWEFFWFADGRVSTQDAQSCAGCHSGAKKDYVFSSPPAH